MARRHWHWNSLRGRLRRTSHGLPRRRVGGRVSTYDLPTAVLAMDDCRDAVAWLCDALFRNRRHNGIGPCANALVLSVLRNVARMVGSRADRFGHGLKCFVRFPPNDHCEATWD